MLGSMSTSCRRKFRNGNVANQELARCYANRGTEVLKKKQWMLVLCDLPIFVLGWTVSSEQSEIPNWYQVSTRKIEVLLWRQFCLGSGTMIGMWVGLRHTVELWPWGFNVLLWTNFLHSAWENFPVYWLFESNSHVFCVSGFSCWQVLMVK